MVKLKHFKHKENRKRHGISLEHILGMQGTELAAVQREAENQIHKSLSGRDKDHPFESSDCGNTEVELVITPSDFELKVEALDIVIEFHFLSAKPTSGDCSYGFNLKELIEDVFECNINGNGDYIFENNDEDKDLLRVLCELERFIQKKIKLMRDQQVMLEK